MRIKITPYLKIIHVEEQLIGFKLAKLAKLKGFDELCSFHYSYGNGDNEEPKIGHVYIGGFSDEEGQLRKYKNSELSNWMLPYGEFTSPTQSLLQTWLRKVHKINVWVEHGSKNSHDITVSGIGCIRGGYETYEKALEKGLEIGLNLVK